MRTTPILCLLCLLGTVTFAPVFATDCGDGPSDGTVPHCCSDQNGICDTVCEDGWGLTSDRTTCVKCLTDSSCAVCSGDDPTVCKQRKVQIPHCGYSNGVQCFNCEDNYDEVNDSSGNIIKCVKSKPKKKTKPGCKGRKCGG